MEAKRPRSRTSDRCRSMDVVCDTLMVEEILPRLPPMSLIRLGAASRRYNALVVGPDFAARYWRRAGVLFQPLSATGPAPESRPLFFSSPPAAAPMFGADLSFLPAPSAREKAYLYLRHVGASGCAAGSGSVAVVVHSAAGLLLCSRGRLHPAHYYVCNPVSGQWVALPELPSPSDEWQSGLLRVHSDGDRDMGKKPNKFQVLLFNHPIHWQTHGRFDLRLFSSDTGQWKKFHLQPPIFADDYWPAWSPIGQSGAACWTIRIKAEHQAVVYNGDEHSIQVIPLPRRHSGKFHIGERHGGGLRYALSTKLAFEVWDHSQTKGGDGSMWTLAHRVRIAELFERNPEAADFLFNASAIRATITPLGFHPTDDDVVFLGISAVASSSASSEAVAAYSIENGTMSLHELTNCFPRSRDMFPYVHPPYLVQIPAIKELHPSSITLVQSLLRENLNS